MSALFLSALIVSPFFAPFKVISYGEHSYGSVLKDKEDSNDDQALSPPAQSLMPPPLQTVVVPPFTHPNQLEEQPHSSTVLRL